MRSSRGFQRGDVPDLLEFHEFVTGPLNGVRNPVKTPVPAANPEVLYAEGGLFNFGYYQIVRRNGKMHFIADVRDEHGGRVSAQR